MPLKANKNGNQKCPSFRCIHLQILIQSMEEAHKRNGLVYGKEK